MRRKRFDLTPALAQLGHAAHAAPLGGQTRGASFLETKR